MRTTLLSCPVIALIYCGCAVLNPAESTATVESVACRLGPEVRAEITDENNLPIKGASLIVGAASGSMGSMSNSEGIATVTVSEGPCSITVMMDGFKQVKLYLVLRPSTMYCLRVRLAHGSDNIELRSGLPIANSRRLATYFASANEAHLTKRYSGPGRGVRPAFAGPAPHPRSAALPTADRWC